MIRQKPPPSTSRVRNTDRVSVPGMVFLRGHCPPKGPRYVLALKAHSWPVILHNRKLHTVGSGLLFPVSVIAHIYVRTKQRHHSLQTASDEPSPILRRKVTKKKKGTLEKEVVWDILLTFRSESFHAQATADNARSTTVMSLLHETYTTHRPSNSGPGDVVKICCTPERVWRFSKRRTWRLRCPGIIVFHIYILTEDLIRNIHQQRRHLGRGEGPGRGGVYGRFLPERWTMH